MKLITWLLLLCSTAAYAQFALSTTAATSCNSTSCTSISFTVPSGNNIVIVGLPTVKSTATGTWAPTMSVTDSGSRTYSNTSSYQSAISQVTYQGTFVSYYLNVPAGSYTVTAVVDASSKILVSMIIVVSVTGGTPFYDKDAYNIQNTAATTPILLPSITPSKTGELLYNIIDPGTGGIGPNPPWTNANNLNGCCNLADGYILSSAAGATTVNMSDGTSSDTWVSMVSAFGINYTSNGTRPVGSFW